MEEAIRNANILWSSICKQLYLQYIYGHVKKLLSFCSSKAQKENMAGVTKSNPVKIYNFRQNICM